ncbi:hypothetical protein MNV84_01250 [Leishmania braziliensis]|nr:hypothetical protein MNV84_01250 [Leishmania braziliensis]
MASLTGSTVTAASFSEEDAIVLDKWLYDVCGEEDLQFPSHRRQQFPRYVERLRRVAKMKQFVANTFEYPARSGTREVLVLQRMLEALALRAQTVARETEQAKSNVRQVRRVLEEQTMGASAIVEEERAHAISEAAEQRKAKEAAAAHAQSYASSPQHQGYMPLDPAAARGDNGAATPAWSGTATPKPQQADDEASGEGGDASATQQGFSAAMRTARRADYEKKKALSLRYVSEMQTKTQDMSRQRAEMEQRHARLLADKERLEGEYDALQTTEKLVVARHQETESRKNEETLLLSEEAAMYAAEEAAFDTAWAECAVLLDEEPSALCSTGEPECRAEKSHLPIEVSHWISPAPQGPSLSALSHPSSAPPHPLSGTLSPAHSSYGGDPGDAGAAAPPDTTSPTAAAPNQGDNTRNHSGSPSSQSPGDGASGPAPPFSSPPLQRQTLEALRHRLSEIGSRTTRCRRHLLNEGHIHLERFRQSQQRLEEWQNMAAQLRRSHHQLCGQVSVIHTVLSDTASRLENSGATAQYTGYGTQLSRLKALLQERSNETLQYYLGNREDATMDMLFDASAEEELRELQRPSPSKGSAGGGLTPVRGVSASVSNSTSLKRQSSTATSNHSRDDMLPSPASSRTPVRGTANGGGPAADAPSSGAKSWSSTELPHRHRSRYELVRHLQRWESMLLADRLAILKVARMVPGPYSGTGANTKQVAGFSAAQAYQELCALLLQQMNPAAPSA